MDALRKYLAAGAIIAFVGAGPLSAPANEPPTSPSTDTPVVGPSLSSPRFGLVVPTARSPLMQPMLDRFANDLLQRVAADAAITILRLPTVDGSSVATLEACRDLGLAGFMSPHRRTSVTNELVTVEGGLNVSDCSGRLFYAGEATHSVKRDTSAIPQTQLDAVQADTMAELVHDFHVERHAHAAAWSTLTQTGALEPLAPSPAPAASPSGDTLHF